MRVSALPVRGPRAGMRNCRDKQRRVSARSECLSGGQGDDRGRGGLPDRRRHHPRGQLLRRPRRGILLPASGGSRFSGRTAGENRIRSAQPHGAGSVGVSDPRPDSQRTYGHCGDDRLRSLHAPEHASADRLFAGGGAEAGIRSCRCGCAHRRDSGRRFGDCRKKTGLAYATSTDSDIYLYDLQTEETENLCKNENDTGKLQSDGYDINPQFSPDGKFIAWQSMERDGYESDLNRLVVLDLEKKEKFNASSTFPTNVDTYVWNPTSDGFYLTGTWHGTEQIYRLGLNDWKENKAPEKITEGLHDYGSIVMNGNELIATRHSMSQADELYAVPVEFNGKYSETTQLTTENKHIYDKLEMGRVEKRWIKTTDGKEMLTWIIYPPQFDANKQYPALLYCEGGPQSPLSQFWSYRWNFQIMAANDYIIVAPCRRGMPGFGVEWNEAISGDYGGQCMKDYLTAIDEIAKEPFVDGNRLGCVGASFGGFSVYWLAGHHDKRFKAFIAHDGIFNMEMQYLETEEKWFANWDMGGAYWDKNNSIAQRTFANSPHRFVDKWDTPILCIHGEKDYRILANQAMAAFDAAKMRGIPAELLIFPDENHWVLQPQNGVLWQRTFFNWLDKWVKNTSTKH